MRTRQGFVSNSSSVSFTIYGVSLDLIEANDGLIDLYVNEMMFSFDKSS